VSLIPILPEGIEQMLQLKNIVSLLKRLDIGAVTTADLDLVSKKANWGFDLQGLMPLIAELQKTHSDSSVFDVITDGTVMKLIMDKAGVKTPSPATPTSVLMECPHCNDVFMHKL